MGKGAYENKEIDPKPFGDLVGDDIIAFVFERAPKKVSTRVAKALEHYSRARVLTGIDEEMGVIRLIAAEEELVVAIFEWLKLKEHQFPEHKDFVRKFKNHVVKLSFYPVLSQFRFIVADMLKGFGPEGLEDVLRWTAKPVVEGARVRVALLDDKGAELIRNNPLAFDISRSEVHGKDIVPILLEDFAHLIKTQRSTSVKEFLSERADFRNKLLYATDAGSVGMEDSLSDLIEIFKQTYHDLIWVLAILIGGEPPSKQWGVVSQFIGLYREVLILAGILQADNTPAIQSPD